ncbi:hypothetical protein KW784_00965 [Candidatus Parcubacteria bacterium]|nr:hypothetical protein [Candidatus Parcubacteria bacterium]
MRLIIVDGPEHLDVSLYARRLAVMLALPYLEADRYATVSSEGAVIARASALFNTKEAVHIYLCDKGDTVAPPEVWPYEIWRHENPDEAVRSIAQLCYLVAGRPRVLPRAVA